MKDQKSMKMLSAIGGIGENIIDEAKAVRQVRRRPRVLMAVAAVLGLLTVLFMTSVAATYDIGFYVSQTFGGDIEMLNEMYAVTDNVRVRGNNDDVKFDVVGIVGDRNTAYVWIDVTLSEAVDLEGKYLMFGKNIRAEKNNIEAKKKNR